LPGGTAVGGTANPLPLQTTIQVSRVVKGCWQLSGGHKGDRKTDRTAGSAAVNDFSRFVSSGVTTFDTADIYGPSERLIGEYLKTLSETERSKVQARGLQRWSLHGDGVWIRRQRRRAAAAVRAATGVAGHCSGRRCSPSAAAPA